MAKPIIEMPESATAGNAVRSGDAAEENLEAIVEVLQEAGVLRFVRALLEQRKPIAEKVMNKMDTDPTKRGLKNGLTLALGLGALPDGFGMTMITAIKQGLNRAQEASHAPSADKMSIWQLMGMLKDPDVARAIHYIVGFLEGLGKALGTNESH
ncbi:MAG: DUF1641 domain-containing protein [Thermaerobacter sp.]|nr:DUF1641 domain-containing protein [Thermaerobacter sp.]